jgi:hypothetical protein
MIAKGIDSSLQAIREVWIAFSFWVLVIKDLQQNGVGGCCISNSYQVT